MLEMMVAMVASAFLLAGLGSVMFIARQVAYTPTAASRRAKTADIINQISDELRYATVITQQTSQILEFVVADRNNDGTAEKIRYEWSGIAGDPLRKTVNGGTAVDVLTVRVRLQRDASAKVEDHHLDHNDRLGRSRAARQRDRRDRHLLATLIRAIFVRKQITPRRSPACPPTPLAGMLTKIDFHGKQNGTATETLTVQLRPTGDPNDGPTSNVLGQTTHRRILDLQRHRRLQHSHVCQRRFETLVSIALMRSSSCNKRQPARR